MLIMKRRVGCSGAMRVINKAIAVLVLSLLLVGCGGGSSSDNSSGSGDGPETTGVSFGDNGSESAPRAFAVTGTITLQSLAPALLEGSGAAVLEIQQGGFYEPPPQFAGEVFAGYVAAAGIGPPGIRADESEERYQLLLHKGQHIVLEFEGSASAYLHLYLLNEFGEGVDAALYGVKGPSAGLRHLSLLVPETGNFIVRVFADRGRAAYSLRLFPTIYPAHEHRRGPRVSDEFVAHQVLVNTRPGLSASLASRAHALGLHRLRGGPLSEELWEVVPGQASRVLDTLRGWRPRSSEVVRWAKPELSDRYETLLIARSLRLEPEVLSVSPNYVLRSQQVLPNDPRQAEQWFHGSISLPEAWAISTGFSDDSEVVVAVVDTGVFREHEDLEGRLFEGHDFVRDQSGGDDPGPGSSHGTHVTGIVGAATDNGKGVSGVSWGAMTLPVRALTDENGTLANLLDGIRYSAGLPNSSGRLPERRADVINLSLGGEFPCNANHREFFRDIRDRGIFLVAASGNSSDGRGSITFPASCDAVFAVGATDRHFRRAGYSNFGGGLDFVAPGGLMRNSQSPDGILSTIAPESSDAPETGYAFYQGTSMATAVASGVVALAKAVDPSLTPGLFSEMLECGLLTDDLGSAGWDSETGWGQINALKTLSVVRDNRDGRVQLPATSVGTIHVRLLNAAGETVAASAVEPRNCGYTFSFEHVLEGDYWIVAGTDSEAEDWAFCNAGEFCGAYPALASPEPVRVDRDRSDLDFGLVPGG